MQSELRSSILRFQLREWPFLAVLIPITPQDSHVLLGRAAATMKNFDNYPNQIYSPFVCPQSWAGLDQTQVHGLRSLLGKAAAGKFIPNLQRRQSALYLF